MLDNGVVFLTCSGKESGNVHQRNDRNVECVAETNEACCLAAGIYVQYTCVSCGLVGNDTYAATVEACETDDDVLGKLRLNLEELAVVRDGSDNLIHIVSLVGIVRNNLVKRVLHTVDGVVALHAGSLFRVVAGDE